MIGFRMRRLIAAVHESAAARRIKLRSEDEELQRLLLETQHLIELRNTVDKLERAAEGARGILSLASFEDADKLSIAEAEALVADLREALRRSKREEAPFFQRLFWALLMNSRNRQLLNSVGDLDKALTRLGFDRERSFLPERSLAEGVEFIGALKAASAYKAALKLLSSTPDMGVLAAKVADETRNLADVSSEAWSSWTALLPDRLNEQDRAALGDYAAILRTISRAEEEGGTIAKQVWHRYYQLVAKTANALPCWAVTSLCTW
jgi:hypothetical protein